ncbi:MAG: dethiobiotin synthase [Flavobacterium sp.]
MSKSKKHSKVFFVTGIDTNVGKTLVCAILTEAFQADYFKPIQSGTLEGADHQTVKSLINNSKSVIHPNVYSFPDPVSPHLAAKLVEEKIELSKIKLPKTTNHLIVEGAGGVLVPINDEATILDVISPDMQVLVVTKNYLGSINHTLLTLNALKEKGLQVVALVVSGDRNPETERIIQQMSGVPIWFAIEQEPYIDQNVVAEYTEMVQDTEIFKQLMA